MAYFAKVDENNVVLEVVIVNEDIVTTVQAGIDFLKDLYGDNNVSWIQTFDDGTRIHYAGKGYKYNLSEDAFIPPKPFNSWTLNEETCLWEAPTAYPDDGKFYNWNEENQTWDEINNE